MTYPTDLALRTARMMDQLLPLLSVDVRDAINESTDESILAIDGHEAELTRLLDREDEEAAQQGYSTDKALMHQDAVAKIWLRTIREAIAHAVVEG